MVRPLYQFLKAGALESGDGTGEMVVSCLSKGMKERRLFEEAGGSRAFVALLHNSVTSHYQRVCVLFLFEATFSMYHELFVPAAPTLIGIARKPFKGKQSRRGWMRTDTQAVKEALGSTAALVGFVENGLSSAAKVLMTPKVLQCILHTIDCLISDSRAAATHEDSLSLLEASITLLHRLHCFGDGAAMIEALSPAGLVSILLRSMDFALSMVKGATGCAASDDVELILERASGFLSNATRCQRHIVALPFKTTFQALPPTIGILRWAAEGKLSTQRHVCICTNSLQLLSAWCVINPLESDTSLLNTHDVSDLMSSLQAWIDHMPRAIREGAGGCLLLHYVQVVNKRLSGVTDATPLPAFVMQQRAAHGGVLSDAQWLRCRGQGHIHEGCPLPPQELSSLTLTAASSTPPTAGGQHDAATPASRDATTASHRPKCTSQSFTGQDDEHSVVIEGLLQQFMDELHPPADASPVEEALWQLDMTYTLLKYASPGSAAHYRMLIASRVLEHAAEIITRSSEQISALTTATCEHDIDLRSECCKAASRGLTAIIDAHYKVASAQPGVMSALRECDAHSSSLTAFRAAVAVISAQTARDEYGKGKGKGRKRAVAVADDVVRGFVRDAITLVSLFLCETPEDAQRMLEGGLLDLALQLFLTIRDIDLLSSAVFLLAACIDRQPVGSSCLSFLRTEDFNNQMSWVADRALELTDIVPGINSALMSLTLMVAGEMKGTRGRPALKMWRGTEDEIARGEGIHFNPDTDRVTNFNSSEFGEGRPVARRCAMCHQLASMAVPLSACGGCRATLYCSRDCQRLHWTKGGHRKLGKKQKGACS